jgi:ferredoxin
MKRVCAWCNSAMSPVKTGGKASANMLTHSICSDCSDNLDFQLGVSLTTYLDSFKIPVVALDGNGFLIGVNRAASEIYKGKAVIDSVEWQEKVFECAHARLPQGCKKAVHCSGCAIRIVTSESFRSGESSHNVPAHLDHCSSDRAEKAELLISADKTDNIVFLRIVRL